MIFNYWGKFPSKACIIILHRLPPRLSSSGRRLCRRFEPHTMQSEARRRAYYPLSLEGYDWSKERVTCGFLGYKKRILQKLSRALEVFMTGDSSPIGMVLFSWMTVSWRWSEFSKFLSTSPVDGMCTRFSWVFKCVSPNLLKESGLILPRKSGSMICSIYLFYCKFIAQSPKLTFSLGRDRSREDLAQRNSH